MLTPGQKADKRSSAYIVSLEAALQAASEREQRLREGIEEAVPEMEAELREALRRLQIPERHVPKNDRDLIAGALIACDKLRSLLAETQEGK